MCDLEIEEKRFSRTFHTFVAKWQPIVRARIEGVSVKLMNVNSSFSFNF